MFTNTIKKETREELLLEHNILECKLKVLEEKQKEKQLELKKVLNELNSIEESIVNIDKEFENNCFKLQDLK